MVTNPQVRLTVQDYLSIPEEDENRYELIDGELILLYSHSWVHQSVLGNLMSLLHKSAHAGKMGESVAGLLDVFLSEHDVFHPDLLFISNERRGIIHSDGLYGAPDFAIEVLSTETEQRDLTIKRERYEKFDVREYWQVNTTAETITVLRSKDGKFEQVGVFGQGAAVETPLLPDMVADVSAVFDYYVPTD